MVHRGRHQGVLRQPRPRGAVGDPARRHPRRPVPAADQEPAQGGVPGGLDYHRTRAERRKGAWSARSSPTSTSTGWTGSSRHTLIPEYTRGATRKDNPEYEQTERQAAHAADEPDGPTRGRRSCASRCDGSRASTPTTPTTADSATSGTPTTSCWASRDQGRSRGDQAANSGTFLRDHLKLELSEEKTLITHGRTGAARFLGYDLTVMPATPTAERRAPDGQRASSASRCRRTSCGRRCAAYRSAANRSTARNGPTTRPSRIVARYEASIGASWSTTGWPTTSSSSQPAQWVMERSLTKTLAAQLQDQRHQVYRRYRRDHHDGPAGHARSSRSPSPRRETPLVATGAALAASGISTPS